MAEIDLDKLSQSELIELKRSLLEYWLSNRAKLQSAKPKEDDYRRTANFEENLAQWELNFQKNEKLFSKQKEKLDNRIKKRSKPKHLTESEILNNMYEEELKVLPLLETKGRTILPDVERKNHSQIIGRRLGMTGEPNSSVDLLKSDPNTGKVTLTRRRFYDSKGKVEQDFDYNHQNSSGNHVFPHIHIWINDIRWEPIKFR